MRASFRLHLLKRNLGALPVGHGGVKPTGSHASGVQSLQHDQAISVVRRALTSSDADQPHREGSLAVGLRTLRRRLWAIQSRGGPYAAVAASQQLDALFQQIEADRSVA